MSTKRLPTLTRLKFTLKPPRFTAPIGRSVFAWSAGTATQTEIDTEAF
ncbi:MAG TPA: hypothetical protein VGE36_17245 [Roseateles sp.]